MVPASNTYCSLHLRGDPLECSRNHLNIEERTSTACGCMNLIGLGGRALVDLPFGSLRAGEAVLRPC